MKTSKTMRAINLLTLIAFSVSNFLTPVQASAFSSSFVKPASFQFDFSVEALAEPMYWAGQPMEPSDRLYWYRREAYDRLAKAAAVPTKFLKLVAWRLKYLEKPSILKKDDLFKLIIHTSGLSLTKVESVPLAAHFRAAKDDQGKGFNDIAPEKDLSLVGPMRIAIALQHAGFIGSATGLDTKSQAGKDEKEALKRGVDLVSEAVLNHAAEDLGVRLQYQVNENKGEVEGSVQSGYAGGDLAGKPTYVVVDTAERTGDIVARDRARGGASSLYLQSTDPDDAILGQFPDTVRGLMVAANINRERVPELIKAVNIERRKYGEPLIPTSPKLIDIAIEQLLDPALDPAILLNRIALLNDVTPDDIDVAVLPNGDGKDGKYELKNIEGLQQYFGGLRVNPVSEGTVRPSVAALLGAKNPTGKKRVKVFLGRSGMTEAYWSLGLAKEMQGQGAYAGFRVVSDKVKENRKKGFARFFDDSAARYAMWEARSDWDESTRREKIYSARHFKGTLLGSCTFITPTSQDNEWPIDVDGAVKDGDADYTVHTIQFTDGNVRMVKGHLHANLPLPGEIADPSKRTVHPGEHEKLPTLAEVLLHPKIDSLFNIGFAPAIKRALLHLPGSDFLKKRFKSVTPALIRRVESQMEKKRKKFKSEISPWTAEEAEASIYVNLKKIFDHGNLGGTGYLSILPVDQSIEHNHETYAQNEEMADPVNLMRLAIESGTNAIALGLGDLEIVAGSRPDLMKQMPVIAKINHANQLSTPEAPVQDFYGGTPEQSVERAYAARSTAIGLTLYMGLPENEFRTQIQEAGRAITRAKQLGMPVVLWTYVRSTDAKLNSMATAPDVTMQANTIGKMLGAHIIKQKLPEGNEEALKAIGKKNLDDRFYNELVTTNLTDKVSAELWGLALGQVPLINSGGASTGKGILADAIDAVFTAVGNLLGGGTGMIMGRKAFQKLLVDGSHLIKLVQAVYLLSLPEGKLNRRQIKLLREVGVTDIQALYEKYHPTIARLAVAA